MKFASFFIASLWIMSIEGFSDGRGLKGFRGVSTAQRQLKEDSAENEDGNVEEEEQSPDSPKDDNDDNKSSKDKNESNDEDEEYENSPDKRECKLSQDDDEVEFECKAKVEDEENDSKIKDKIDFKVKKKSGRGITTKIEYEQEAETDEQETESETEYEVVFDTLVEYAKTSSSSGGEEYDWENDEIVQTVSLMDMGDFSDVVDDGDTAHFSISTLDEVATFTFTIHRASVDESISANQIKIDFELNNFNWMRDDTYLALMSSVESERSLEVEYENADDEDIKVKDVVVNFAEVIDGDLGFEPFGEFTWSTTAEATTTLTTDLIMSEAGTNVTHSDNTEFNTTEDTTDTVETKAASTIEVIASSPKTGTDVLTSRSTSTGSTSSQAIAFSFVGDAAKSASYIYWDPEAGIGYVATDEESGAATSSASKASMATFLMGIIGTMMVLAI